MRSRFFSRGLLYSIGVVINRVIPSRLFRFRVFDIHQLEQPTGDRAPQSPGDDLSFRWCATEHEFVLAAKQTRNHAAQRDATTAACLVMCDDVVIGGIWRTTSSFDEADLGIRIDLGDNEAWVFSAYVEKDRRGCGVYRRLLIQLLQQHPAADTFAAINPTNRASRAAHRRFIRRTVGRCVAVRVWNCSAAWATGGIRLDRRLSCDSRRPIRVSWR